ncbi:MAG: class I SAM-dependent methyltransferase [bacterium]
MNSKDVYAPDCAFCQSRGAYLYRMGEYPVCQCVSCGTGFVHPMPDQETLRKLYDGFIPNLDAGRMPDRMKSASMLFPQLGLKPGNNLKMLDIGGGGGFFCRAFEDLRYGAGTYVDIDRRSCCFARETMGLKAVLECDAMMLREHSCEKFDFIYCRHLIEHLPEPTVFLKVVAGFLAGGGILVVQFPNADSLEYLAYAHLNIGYRFDKIRKSSDFSRWKTLYIMLAGGILHGMDPPRHIWAISRKGITVWARANRFACRSFARHLGDPAFSPGYAMAKETRRRLRDFIGQKILGPIKGGTHLVAILSRTPDNNRRGDPA